jgi:hypothetical protein
MQNTQVGKGLFSSTTAARPESASVAMVITVRSLGSIIEVLVLHGSALDGREEEGSTLWEWYCDGRRGGGFSAAPSSMKLAAFISLRRIRNWFHSSDIAFALNFFAHRPRQVKSPIHATLPVQLI